MFATAINKKNTGENEPGATADHAPGNDAPAKNPLWQSLAFNVLPVQRKPTLSEPGDADELQADRIADQIMRTPVADESPVTRPRLSNQMAVPALVHKTINSPGQPLDRDTRSFMEARFNNNFDDVRVHTDRVAGESANAVNALAFTVGHDVVFAPEHYRPESETGKRLLAHELAHVVQQTNAPAPVVQRRIEVRPLRGRQNSAFARRDELIDRINQLSMATHFRLNGTVLEFDDVPGGAATNFEQQLRAFIGRGDIVPLRLVTGASHVGGRPLFVDDYRLAYVDLDDMLASDDVSFQMNLLHLLAERFNVRRYEHRIGAPGLQVRDPSGALNPEFRRAHAAGVDAEAELLRDVIGDPTIRPHFEEARGGGTTVFSFRSNEGYRVVHIFRGPVRSIQGGEIFVRTRDGRRITINQLRVERAAAAPPVAPVPAPAVP